MCTEQKTECPKEIIKVCGRCIPQKRKSSLRVFTDALLTTALMTLLLITSLFSLSSCDDEIHYIQEYQYQVETLPIPSTISQGETVEIRCSIIEGESWDGAEYYLRYFQTKGSGVLKDQDGNIFTPNDLFKVSNKQFNLYYTSTSSESQELDITFFNNFSTKNEISLKFNNLDIEENE